MCCPSRWPGSGLGRGLPPLVCGGEGLSRPRAAGGKRQLDNKSPLRAMASRGLFSASVGRDGGSSHVAQITCLLLYPPCHPKCCPEVLCPVSKLFFQLKGCLWVWAHLSCLGGRHRGDKQKNCISNMLKWDIFAFSKPNISF